MSNPVYAAELRFELPEDFDGTIQEAMELMAEYILEDAEPECYDEEEIDDDLPTPIKLNPQLDDAYQERPEEARIVFSDGVVHDYDGDRTVITDG